MEGENDRENCSCEHIYCRSDIVKANVFCALANGLHDEF